MSNTLQVLVDDAERIVPQLVPSVNKLPEIVGVLAKHLEQLAGKELTSLADDVLGIQPPAAEQAAAADQQAAPDAQAVELAEAKKELAAMQERLAALETPVAWFSSVCFTRSLR